MLYDPKWEVKVKPSLADFAAWLRTQDPTHNYAKEWHSPFICPCGRYSVARFGDWAEIWKVSFLLASEISHTAVPEHPRATYSELLAKVEKLLP